MELVEVLKFIAAFVIAAYALIVCFFGDKIAEWIANRKS